MKLRLTAGSAKNDIPRSAQNDAIIFPCHVSGTISPYPTVDFQQKKAQKGLKPIEEKIIVMASNLLCSTYLYIMLSVGKSENVIFRIH